MDVSGSICPLILLQLCEPLAVCGGLVMCVIVGLLTLRLDCSVNVLVTHCWAPRPQNPCFPKSLLIHKPTDWPGTWDLGPGTAGTAGPGRCGLAVWQPGPRLPMLPLTSLWAPRGDWRAGSAAPRPLMLQEVKVDAVGPLGSTPGAGGGPPCWVSHADREHTQGCHERNCWRCGHLRGHCPRSSCALS